MRILGVDPGTVRLGFGCIEGTGARPSHVQSGVCRAADAPVAKRLAHLQRQLRGVMEALRPQVVALESSFHGKNPQALLRLGEARGIVIGLAGLLELPVFDYTPADVKKAVTGRGNAGKEAVARLVHASVAGAPDSAPADATDALAVAVCHFHRSRLAALGLTATPATRTAGRKPRLALRIPRPPHRAP